MHELSLAQAIADTTARYADGRPVAMVRVRIGHLRQVVPDSLQFAWELLTVDSVLDGAGLSIEHVPAVVRCADCGGRYGKANRVFHQRHWSKRRVGDAN